MPATVSLPAATDMLAIATTLLAEPMMLPVAEHCMPSSGAPVMAAEELEMCSSDAPANVTTAMIPTATPSTFTTTANAVMSTAATASLAATHGGGEEKAMEPLAPAIELPEPAELCAIGEAVFQAVQAELQAGETSAARVQQISVTQEVEQLLVQHTTPGANPGAYAPATVQTAVATTSSEDSTSLPCIHKQLSSAGAAAEASDAAAPACTPAPVNPSQNRQGTSQVPGQASSPQILDQASPEEPSPSAHDAVQPVPLTRFMPEELEDRPPSGSATPPQWASLEQRPPIAKAACGSDEAFFHGSVSPLIGPALSRGSASSPGRSSSSSSPTGLDMWPHDLQTMLERVAYETVRLTSQPR